MSKSWTLLAKSWKYWKNTPLGLNPIVTALMRKYSGQDNILSSVLTSDEMDSIGSGLTGATDSYGSVIKNLNNALNQLLKGDSLENLIKWLTHSGQTDESRETMANQLKNQQILNAEEYDRKIDFYERYESPSAMVRQYQEAGLNPMMLAGSGAGQSATGGVGSAGSADTAGPGAGNLLSAISAIASLSLQQKQLQIQEQDANTRLYDAETRRMQSHDYMAYLRSMTTKTDVETQQMVELFPVKKANIEAQTTQFLELAKTEEGRRALMAAKIDLIDAEKALKMRQAAILAAQEKYADRYFKAVAELTEYQSKIAYVQSDFERRTLEKRISGLEATVNDMILQAGLSAKAFENFDAAQAREWLNSSARVVSSLGALLIGGASAAGKFGGSRPVASSNVEVPVATSQFNAIGNENPSWF